MSIEPSELAAYIKRRGYPVCDAMRLWLSGDVSVPSLPEFRSRFGWGERTYTEGIPSFGETAGLMAERDHFINEFAFAVPTRAALARIAAFSPLVEIGAGSGAWAKLLAMRGADIIATDPAYETYQFIELFGTELQMARGRWQTLYHPVLPLEGKTAVRRWSKRNVFCCWPSLGQTWLRQAARAMQQGRALIVVSEDACADERTWDYLKEAFTEVGDYLRLPNWHFMNDHLEVWVKKGHERYDRGS